MERGDEVAGAREEEKIKGAKKRLERVLPGGGFCSRRVMLGDTPCLYFFIQFEKLVSSTLRHKSGDRI